MVGVESDRIASDMQPKAVNFVIRTDFDTLVTAMPIPVAARSKT
jgi:hypothetical protein